MSAEAPVATDFDDLRARIAALQMHFTDVGVRAARAAADATTLGAPPSEELINALAAAAHDFYALRDDILEVAATLEVVLPNPADAIGSLRDLTPVLDAVSAASAAAERRRRLDAARAAALAVIDRVQTVAHRDAAAFPPLAECQARARTLRDTIATADGGDSDVSAWAQELRPFADLLEMLEGQGTVDDERWTELADGVSAAFGRPLATAATRGRLRIR
jgi:ABC-type transporter Mla subunit MlaD